MLPNLIDALQLAVFSCACPDRLAWPSSWRKAPEHVNRRPKLSCSGFFCLRTLVDKAQNNEPFDFIHWLLI
jgi:hypothetical protein